MNSPILSSIAAIRERKVCAFAAIVFLAIGGLSAAAPPPAGEAAQDAEQSNFGERLFNTPHLSEADKLDRRAEELFKAGKYSEAIPLATQSLDLREKALGPEHPGTATSLNNLGFLYATMRDYAKAEPLYQRALAIREKTLGPDHPTTATSLNNLAGLYQQKGDYAKAEPLLQRALKIREKALGPEHPGTAQSLNDLASIYYSMGNYAKVEPLLQRALKIREKALGPDHAGTAESLNSLAVLYRDRGDSAKAEPLFQRALKIREKALGPEHRGTAQSLNDLAQLYANIGDYAKAEPLLQHALKIREKALGPEHLGTAQSLNDLAQLYANIGDYARAEPLLQHVLKIREKALGPEHPATATSLDNLGLLYTRMADYGKAEPLLQRALKIREKALGPEHPATATSLDDLGLLYGQMADYGKTELLLQRALKIREKAFGPEHPATATSLDNLGLLYTRMADYGKDEKAEPLLQRALKIREKTLGPEQPATAASLNNLAQLYENTGDYAKAEPLFQRALQVYEKTFGPNDLRTANTVGNLGQLYWNMADYGKAEPLLTRALTIREKTLGPEHPTTGVSVTNLAWFYRTLGDYAKAEPLLRRALNISEKKLGPNHPETATCLQNLATLYVHFHNYAKAEPLYQRALAIREKTLGPEHPRTGVVLDHIASMYRDMGDYAKAVGASRRALEIQEKSLGPDHPYLSSALDQLAVSYRGLGDYSKAKPLYERALNICKKVRGPENPQTAQTLNSLGFLDVAINDLQGAFRVAGQARRIREKNLSDILSFTSEQQRLALQEEADPYDLLATIADASDLAETVLRQKGIVLDSLLEDRLVAEASGDPKQREIVSELRSAKRGLLQLQLETPKDISEEALKKRDQEKKEISQRVEELEGGLARRVAGLGHARRALSVTVPQVQAALRKDETLIELLRYGRYLGKDKFEPHYGAIVIAASGEPAWVPLGQAAEIEKNVGLYQKSVRGKTDEATLSSVLKALNSQVWVPIEKALPAGTRTVIVSPDAELSFVSFATLVGTDDKFVGEKYSVRYVASGRDLLREFKTASNSQANVYANPDFGSKPASLGLNGKTAVALRSLEMRDLQNISLPSLPGTATEAAALAKRFGSSAKVLLGPNATKEELLQVNAPHILHLATHGFFLPEIELGNPNNVPGPEEQIPKAKLVNPMHRSGLALAGAQTTLAAWARGDTPPIKNNGIVTAEEVGGLKLDGTWLVVLSACETGSGEARAGEGVMGLRRGFIQAGAQNLLMTLWPISDETTVQIMLDFYAAAEKTKNAPQALADVQRDWLVKLRKERGLLPAVQLAGPFIMSSQGPTR